MSTNPNPGRPHSREGLAALVVITLASIIAFRELVPPPVVPATAPAAEFSAERAMQQLRLIAREPHPAGTHQNARVRDYIVEQLESLGLDPEIQKASSAAAIGTWGPPYFAGSVESILVRLSGTSKTGTVLFMAHYDSVPTAPGATDDGSGVVVLLESLRALRAGPPPRNDAIFAFTDGEEAGSIGAQAFADEHAWGKDVSMAINVDSGGGCGPAVIGFESPHNGWFVREIGKAIPHPVTASVGEELQKLWPHTGGDDAPFTQRGIGVIGMNYVSCLTNYHLMTDSIANTDIRSVQHLGNYALAVARQFCSVDLKHIAEEDLIYFGYLGHLFAYRVKLVRPLMVVELVMFTCVLLLGFRRNWLSWGGIGLSSLVWFGALLVAAGLAGGLQWTLTTPHLVNTAFFSAYNAETYALGYLALTVAATSGLYVAARRKIEAAHLAMGALGSCTVVMVLSCLYAPGASFLLAWPLLIALLSFALGFALDRTDSWLSKTAQLLSGAAATVMFAGLIGYLVIAPGEELGATMIVVAILTALLLALLVPQLEAMTAWRRWLLPGACAILALGFVSMGALRSGYDNGHPKPDSMSYWLEADTGKATWISFDEKPDSWTSQFLQGRIEAGVLGRLGWLKDQSTLKSDAARLALAAPEVRVLGDSSTSQERTFRLRITSRRQARSLWVMVQNASVKRATVDGRRIPVGEADTRDKSWGLVYTGLPSEGSAMDVTVKAPDAPQISVTDQSDGLPEIPGFQVKPRTQDLIPSFWPPFDSTTLVTLTYIAPQNPQ